MKKRNLLLLMLFSCTTFFTSCKEKVVPGNAVEEVTIAITGGSGDVITVLETDVVKDIQIQATENVDRDIEVNLTVNATDGNATLSETMVTIAKGTNKATAKITFIASKFPKNTEEKAIKVTANTNAEKIAFSPDFTIFNVKGEGAKTAVTLTASSGPLQINTTTTIGEAVVNFTLSEALTKDLIIDASYDTSGDFIGTDGVLWSMYPVIIDKGTKTLKLTVTVPKGRTGSMPIIFTTKNTDVTVNIPKIMFKFVETVNPNPEASISTTEALDVKVNGSDIVKTINVKLSKAVDKAVVVNLAATSNNALNGTLSASSVTFDIGELSKTVNITFADADFGKEAEARITVTLTSSDVDIKPLASKILFKVAGPSDKQEGHVRLVFYSDDGKWTEILSGSTITFSDANKTAGFFPISVSGAVNEAFNPSVTIFTLEVEGELHTDDVRVTDSRLIYEGLAYGYFKFNLNSSAIGKTGTIRLASPGTTFAPGQDLVITVK